MKPRKLGIPALLKHRSKAANWTDALGYATEMTARQLGYAAFRNPASKGCESFDGRAWTVDGVVAPVVPGAERAGSLLLDSGCARCGEPLDAKATRGVCSPCEKEVAAKQDRMIEEAAAAEAA
jgi:hypothetical protein